jgi:hypothetical protein
VKWKKPKKRTYIKHKETCRSLVLSVLHGPGVFNTVDGIMYRLCCKEEPRSRKTIVSCMSSLVADGLVERRERGLYLLKESIVKWKEIKKEECPGPGFYWLDGGYTTQIVYVHKTQEAFKIGEVRGLQWDTIAKRYSHYCGPIPHPNDLWT